MRKLLSISLVLNAALAAGFIWKELAVHATGGGAVPAGNGDVNADGALDLSDPVYLLSYLFLAGPKPAPIECPPAARTGLPATGQTRCFDPSEMEIDCASTEFPGQDGFYQAGCPAIDRFVDQSDGTVVDACTGLMWQRETADIDGNGLAELSDRVTWQGALNYCENLKLAGHSDWRLPNVRELQSIVDYGRFNPSINFVFGAMPDGYWSSSPYALVPKHAWYVFFLDGSVGSYDVEHYTFPVRAVRGGR